jgi:hypothetical protein
MLLLEVLVQGQAEWFIPVIPATWEEDKGELKLRPAWAKKLTKLHVKNKDQYGDSCCVIPATWNVEVGGLRSEIGPGKNMRPYLKNKL